jgi:alpha-tubulin suppressor-like RCC1 family protein
VASDLQFVQLSAGNQFACGVTTDASVACWGSNTNDRLGIASAEPFIPHPVIVGIPEKARSVSTGWHHACVVALSGTVYCWGVNNRGQVGDGTTTDRRTPVAIGSGRTFSAVQASGAEHTCGISGPRVHCWGWNFWGQLGDGTTTGATTP